MLSIPVLLIFSFVIGSLARGDWRQSLYRHHPEYSSNKLTDLSKSNDSRRTFKQDIVYRGQDFFSQWDFFTGPDPTHGYVNYQSQGDAQSKGLAYLDGDTVVLAVDNTTTLHPGQNRDSVRITSQKTWNNGLFIADFGQIPFGYSVWPAYWQVGPDWPNGGEIDVVEGVNMGTTNQYTLHTSQGCTASRGSVSIIGQLGSSAQCAVTENNNTGCAYQDTDARSYGQGFNDVGGGVFAHLIDSTGITIWFFTRSDIPMNAQSNSPDPSTWGSPVAYWSSDTCDVAQHFHDLSLVIDTTLCGDWAGSAYATSNSPGTCEQAVADPSNFKNAKWKINSIATYQSVS